MGEGATAEGFIRVTGKERKRVRGSRNTKFPPPLSSVVGIPLHEKTHNYRRDNPAPVLKQAIHLPREARRRDLGEHSAKHQGERC